MELPIGKIICGDSRKVLTRFPAGQIKLILTDPPYHRKYLYLWEPLALFASKLLIPGGILITLVGHHSFDRIIIDMTKHLNFYWIGGMLQSSGYAGRYHPRQMICTSKPVLWLSKGTAQKHDYTFDYFKPKLGNTKYYHEWGQPIGWFLYYIKKLTNPGDIILDPFVGSGTVCVAAEQLGRKWIGIDIDKESCEIAWKRISYEKRNPGFRIFK